MGYLYVALTVLLTAYGQLVLKWQSNNILMPHHGRAGMLAYLSAMLLNPWVLSGLLAAFVASVTWMLALSRLELSQAYPFTAMSFVLILVSSAVLFAEPLNAGKILGTLLVVAGVVVVAWSSRAMAG